MTHKRWQFGEISVHADNEIDTIFNLKNIAKLDGYYYYIILNEQTPPNQTPEMHKSNDFSAADTHLVSGGALSGSHTNKVVRQFDTNIYGFLIKNRTTEIRFNQMWSFDSGDNWSSPQWSVGGTNPDGRVLDVFDIGGEPHFIYTFEDNGVFTVNATTRFIGPGIPTIRTGNTIANINAAFAGFVNGDGDYEYLEYGADSKFYRVTFNGTTFTREEEIIDELTPPDTWNIDRQLYWDVRDRHIILTGNQMYQKLKGVWTLTTVAVEQDVVAVIWKKDSSDEYTFDYVIWNDQLYYFLPQGSIIRLQTLSVDARVGYDDWFSTGSAIHQRFNDELIIDKAFVSQEKMGFRLAVFNVYETTFVIGDGIVLTEDDGTPLIIGNVVSNRTIDGIQAQSIVVFSPGKKDLEKPILQNFGTVDEKEILQAIYANHSEFFYEGIIDDTGNTQTLLSSIRNMLGILKDLEPFGARVIYWELDGKQHYDEADEPTGIVLTDDNSQIVPNGIFNRGQEINAVVVKGGVDPNLPTDAEIPVGTARVPGVRQQYMIPDIFNIPSLATQAQVDARAALI